MIRQVAGPQLSVTVAFMVTDTILWLGGQRVLGVAQTLDITGAMVSTTVTVVLQEAEAPEESVTVIWIMFVPVGN